jgi:PKHD-type hydroxylase
MSKKLTVFQNRVEKYLDKYVVLDGVFTNEELKLIDEYCASYDTEKSYIVSHNGMSTENKDIRLSRIKMHHYNEKNAWFFQRLFQATEHVNDNFFNFELSGFDFFQYTEYDGQGSTYNWHVDMVFGEAVPRGMELMRKISGSLILSDKEDYKGGNFEIMTGGQSAEPVEQKRGSIIFFPSFVMHRVAPLTEGKRKSLVFWVMGPKFK